MKYCDHSFWIYFVVDEMPYQRAEQKDLTWQEEVTIKASTSFMTGRIKVLLVHVTAVRQS